MRCQCCNHALSDYESTMKLKSTGEYADMCRECLKTVEEDVQVRGNPALLKDESDDYEEN